MAKRKKRDTNITQPRVGKQQAASARATGPLTEGAAPRTMEDTRNLDPYGRALAGAPDQSEKPQDQPTLTPYSWQM